MTENKKSNQSILEKLQHTYTQCYKRREYLYTRSDKEMRLALRPFIDEASFVLLRGNQICGFSFVRPRGEEGHLALIGIHPDVQRRNLGTFLLKAVMKKLAQQGLTSISLGVDPVNKPAYNLYRTLGFGEVSRATTLFWRLSKEQLPKY